MRTEKPTCDCTSHCGDDPAIYRGDVEKCDTFKACDAAAAERLAVQRDAERYRWLRERAWYVDAATYALEVRERWRAGDEPPPDADEIENALDNARNAAVEDAENEKGDPQ